MCFTAHSYRVVQSNWRQFCVYKIVCFFFVTQIEYYNRMYTLSLVQSMSTNSAVTFPNMKTRFNIGLEKFIVFCGNNLWALLCIFRLDWVECQRHCVSGRPQHGPLRPHNAPPHPHRLIDSRLLVNDDKNIPTTSTIDIGPTPWIASLIRKDCHWIIHSLG